MSGGNCEALLFFSPLSFPIVVCLVPPSLSFPPLFAEEEAKEMEREEERRRGKGERLFFFSLDKKGRGERNFLPPPRMGEGTVYGEEMASQKREMEHITSKG